jgi:hypothetical protein
MHFLVLGLVLSNKSLVFIIFFRSSDFLAPATANRPVGSTPASFE